MHSLCLLLTIVDNMFLQYILRMYQVVRSGFNSSVVVEA